MPITIGKKAESDYSSPLGLLSDCHRRIERFLDGMIVISEQARGNALNDVQRQHFEVALRYFRDAASKHMLDEEESLFPRLRTHKNGETDAALALLDTLHLEHVDAEIWHRKVDQLGCRWLAEGTLPHDYAQLLICLLKGLRTTYKKHIAVEDTELFPLAERTLGRVELEAIGREMAVRRGLVVSASTLGR